MSNERILPLAAVDRIIRKAGGYRVSEPAVVALAEILEDYGIKLAQQANQLATHANRSACGRCGYAVVGRR
ncbi:MAG: NFYB/HAP3 family transcription factor subunit [Candidatus Diapherotrites archaeon]|nr:NFYB/HAP3 family transcription factor subunit [Candidatus Diapherotrites archaeon]